MFEDAARWGRAPGQGAPQKGGEARIVKRRACPWWPAGVMAFGPAMIGTAPGPPGWHRPPMTTANADSAMPSPAPPECRIGCAACCTAPSISSPIPGMADGKPAGVACVQLDAAGRCRLFDRPERPAVCSSLQPSAEMCGSSRAHAMRWLTRLEAATLPADQPAPCASPR